MLKKRNRKRKKDKLHNRIKWTLSKEGGRNSKESSEKPNSKQHNAQGHKTLKRKYLILQFCLIHTCHKLWKKLFGVHSIFRVSGFLFCSCKSWVSKRFSDLPQATEPKLGLKFKSSIKIIFFDFETDNTTKRMSDSYNKLIISFPLW